MFLRKKKMRNAYYYQIVHNYRDKKTIRQKVLLTLGREEHFVGSGACDSLARSFAKASEKLTILEASDKNPALASNAKSIGPSLLFQRLWNELGIRDTLLSELQDRHFTAQIERALFLTVLHRIFCSGSDRAAEYWKDTIEMDGGDTLQLQHLYRAMQFLGEPADSNKAVIKDRIEEKLFARNADMFTSLDLVFFDTTSLYFYGDGGQTLGKHEYSKDGKGDCSQLILGLLVDKDGTPICSEILPGNTADVRLLIPVIDRLRKRFPIDRVCIVADRGMISRTTIEELEKRSIGYILGVRMRQGKETINAVLHDEGTYTAIERKINQAPLEVKEVVYDGIRYIICRNEDEAEHDRESREAIVSHLREKLSQGSKALIANNGYRKYLTAHKDSFTIDENRIAHEAMFDGIYVLRTNQNMSPQDIALQYKNLWRCEQSFRKIKSVFATRPIYHKTDEGITGHVFCSFLALKLEHELMKRLRDHGVEPEWNLLLQDIQELRAFTITSGTKTYRIRTETQLLCALAFKAAGAAIPPFVQQIQAKTDL